ncbi:hypothetical protein SLS64_013479 [Diaporthe eres]|uniref:Enoyl reductase (ER) domain-containing protein n=1 Tax=Diaporthe eres TaxID=83184 RepID=A0ABR1NQW3_DIAER
MQIYFSSVAESNSAACLVGPRVRPLEVKPAPCPKAGFGGPVLIVKVGAVAINHLDVAAQAHDNLFKRHAVRVGAAAANLLDAAVPGAGKFLQGRSGYPLILGCDLAGEVVQVGWRRTTPGGIRVGDRVLGLALGAVTTDSDPVERFFNQEYASFERAFQEYALVRVHLACVIPDTVTYEQACVFPLTMTIAANALFHEDYLELCRPTVPPREPDASSDVVIITAGASGVGCHAVQLACAAGYWVYSTASPEHFKTVQGYGVKHVFDCRMRNLGKEILSAMREDNRRIAGAVATDIDSVEICRKVFSRYKGGNGHRENNKFIAFTDFPTTVTHQSVPRTLARYIGSKAMRTAFNNIRSRVAGVQIKPVALHNLGSHKNRITRMVFQDFLPRALASDQYLPAPQPKVVGKGLEKVQEAVDALMNEDFTEKPVVMI